MHGGRCLVVLDNLEQVARHTPETLGRWLDRAPEASFVVTTREVLGLPGETSLAIAPLAEGDAEALFLARAIQAKRDFVLPETDRPHVRALLKLLDGLPLAIELAAARVRLMPPRVLLQRMSERFKLLSSSGGRHTRQATLRATLDWSWELLMPDEQRALAQLSVFEGGFTLEAAEAVMSLSEAWPLDAVQALVDKSLVRRVGDERLDLLVSVQEYAAERLSPAERGDAELRHGRWYAAFGEDTRLRRLNAHGGPLLRRALEADLDNLVAGVHRAVSRGDAAAAEGALAASWAILEHRGPIAVGAGLAAEVRAIPAFPLELLSRVEATLGRAAALLGRPAVARAHLDAAIAAARAVGDRGREADALDQLGIFHHDTGEQDAAREAWNTALVFHREVDDRYAQGSSLGSVGNSYSAQGRPSEARACLEEAIALLREAGDRRSAGTVLGNLAIVAYQQGRKDEARVHFDGALAAAREGGNRRFEGIVLSNLGVLHLEHGAPDQARAFLEAALAVARETGYRRQEGITLGNLGALEVDHGRPDVGRAYLVSALAVDREVGNRRSEGIVHARLGRLDLGLGRLDESRRSYERGEALLREIGELLELGKLLCGRALLDRADGRSDDAGTALTEAEAIAQKIGLGPESPLGVALTAARAELAAPRLVGEGGDSA